MFLAYPYDPAPNTGLTIRVAGGAPGSITSAVRQEIRRADPAIPLFNIQTGEEARLNTFWQFRLFGWMFSIFGAIALTLASIGVYGVLSYAVSQRTQEIGVRMALGASRQNVFTLIVRDGARLAGVGILCGVIGAVAVTRVVTSLLYNVSATDPLSFVVHRGIPRARRASGELPAGAPCDESRSDDRASGGVRLTLTQVSFCQCPQPPSSSTSTASSSTAKHPNSSLTAASTNGAASR